MKAFIQACHELDSLLDGEDTEMNRQHSYLAEDLTEWGETGVYIEINIFSL